MKKCMILLGLLSCLLMAFVPYTQAQEAKPAYVDAYRMDYPGYEFHCTCRASRRQLGKRLPNHQLHTVAAYCGYDLTHHHHALADAEACAMIALKLL